MKKQHIIFIPGLRDTNPLNKPYYRLVETVWKRNGFVPHIFYPHWEEGFYFKPKLQAILNLIDELVSQGHSVSLVGQSAGGSAALNAFCQRSTKLNGAINITGRLRAGIQVKPTLESAAKNSPAFKESVTLFEKQNEPKMKSVDRRKVMTFKPLWDETVPSSTVPLNGATNITVPIIEHSIGGGLITIFWAKKFLPFLKELKKS